MQCSDTAACLLQLGFTEGHPHTKALYACKLRTPSDLTEEYLQTGEIGATYVTLPAHCKHQCQNKRKNNANCPPSERYAIKFYLEAATNLDPRLKRDESLIAAGQQPAGCSSY